MDEFKEAAVQFIAGQTLTIEQKHALIVGLMLRRTLTPREVDGAVLLGLDDRTPTTRLKVIERAKKLGNAHPSILEKLEEMAGDNSDPDNPSGGDRHAGVRLEAQKALASFAARQA